jgi:ribosomal protein S18 acetylase RimI-like enzyme
MNKTPTIRRFAPHEWATYKDIRLRALADSPEAFGSTLADGLLRPDAEWAERLETGANSAFDLPLLAEANEKPVGLAWGRIEEPDLATAHLYQVWVDPDYRGLGIGKRMLEIVIAWAKAMDASTLELSVTDRDSPARRLYIRAGFAPARPPLPMRPGSELLELPMRLPLK